MKCIGRYKCIARYLHFSEEESNDKLRKIRPLFEAMIAKFQTTFRPGEHISVDESLLKFKGRLGIKQYNSKKRARFGIKYYKCCDSETGYIYNASIYHGKDDKNESKPLGVSGKAVKDMLGDLSGFGRTIYIDNWYTSPILCSILHKSKNNLTGTVQLKRKFMPKIQKGRISKMKKKDVITFNSKNIIVMLWKDKRVVQMMSTRHGSD